MPNTKLKRTQRTDPRGPLVFDIGTLGSASARSERRTVPAPADLGSGMVRVPEGGELKLDVQLEDVGDGVLVTGLVTAPLVGECARCLDEFRSSTQVQFRELFAAAVGGSGDDGYLLDGDLLDLEPALRDALVLDLPLSPLCRPDCAGLCSRCGMKFADAEPGHAHPDDGGVWAVLKDLFGPEEAERAGDDRAAEPEPGGDGRPEGSKSGTGTSRPEGSKSGTGTSRPEGSKSGTGTSRPEGSKSGTGTSRPEGSKSGTGTSRPEGSKER